MFCIMCLWLTCILFQVMQPQQGAKALNILPEQAIREEIKANICSITLELKYIHQVLRCLKMSTLNTDFLIIARFQSPFYWKKAKNNILWARSGDVSFSDVLFFQGSSIFVMLKVLHSPTLHHSQTEIQLSYTLLSFNCVSASSSHSLHYQFSSFCLSSHTILP